MRRRLLNLLTALSMLLCVAVCVLWVRSYRYVYELAYQAFVGGHVEYRTGLSSLGGRLMYWRDTRVYPSQRPVPQDIARNPGWFAGSDPLRPEEVTFYVASFERTFDAGSYVRFQRLGFRLALSRYEEPRDPEYGVCRSWEVRAPHPFVAAAFALGPLRAGRRWMTERRRRRSRCCTTCGYDLRATPGRCPECGTVASVSTRA